MKAIQNNANGFLNPPIKNIAIKSGQKLKSGGKRVMILLNIFKHPQ